MANSAVEIVHPLHVVPSTFEIGKLGMWVFLAGETMVFGGLMACYTLLWSPGEAGERPVRMSLGGSEASTLWFCSPAV